LALKPAARFAGVNFSLYMNSSWWTNGSAPCGGAGQQSCGEDGSDVDMPDVAMDGVARHRGRFFSQAWP
jgi:hypothetical protein